MGVWLSAPLAGSATCPHSTRPHLCRLCDKKQVLAWFKKAHEERCDYLVHLPKERAADPLRGEAWFDEFVPRRT
jgi:hypothetical protein